MLLPDIPIIISTGYSDRINEKTAKDMGIRHFLEKPLEMAKLAHAVRDTLDSALGNNTQREELT
jgi:DNA-binding NtrC family response regulator